MNWSTQILSLLCSPNSFSHQNSLTPQRICFWLSSPNCLRLCFPVRDLIVSCVFSLTVRACHKAPALGFNSTSPWPLSLSLCLAYPKQHTPSLPVYPAFFSTLASSRSHPPSFLPGSVISLRSLKVVRLCWLCWGYVIPASCTSWRDRVGHRHLTRRWLNCGFCVCLCVVYLVAFSLCGFDWSLFCVRFFFFLKQ